jgi:hypothetical protein
VLDDDDGALMSKLAQGFGFIGERPLVPRVSGEVGLSFPRLTSLSLDWTGDLDNPLAPLARWTQLTALQLRGYAVGAKKADWLPPNLEELHLGASFFGFCLQGVGGGGWLAALNAGACPQLRVLHLTQLAVRDIRPAGRWQGLTLANTLPRLTALEELVVNAFESTDWRAYDAEFEHDEVDDDDHPEYALPLPAAPLLAALPALRHCQAGFARSRHDRRGEEYRFWTFGLGDPDEYRATIPMLLATPAELASLRAPRLESLSIGLVTSSDARHKAWRCHSDSDSDDDNDGDDAAQGGNAAVAAANAPPASAPAPAAVAPRVGAFLPALRSLDLYVGCAHAAGDGSSLWGLSALPPGSLPALRRLLVQPISFICRAAKLPLDALARAAPGLERLVIDPRCAGPLDALFCDGGCALSLRSIVVQPPPSRNAAMPARLEAELRAGLGLRAAAAAAAAAAAGPQRSGDAAPQLKVTLLEAPKPKSSDAAADPASICGAAIERRPFCRYKDEFYIDNFLLPGLRPGPLVQNAYEKNKVGEYERAAA